MDFKKLSIFVIAVGVVLNFLQGSIFNLDLNLDGELIGSAQAETKQSGTKGSLKPTPKKRREVQLRNLL